MLLSSSIFPRASVIVFVIFFPYRYDLFSEPELHILSIYPSYFFCSIPVYASALEALHSHTSMSHRRRWQSAGTRQNPRKTALWLEKPLLSIFGTTPEREAINASRDGTSWPGTDPGWPGSPFSRGPRARYHSLVHHGALPLHFVSSTGVDDKPPSHSPSLRYQPADSPGLVCFSD